MRRVDVRRLVRPVFWALLVSGGACQAVPDITAPGIALGGRVVGAQGPVQLACNGVAIAPVQSGAFACPGPWQDGEAYAVTVVSKPLGQSCTLAAGTGVASSSSRTAVVVTCTGARLPALSLDISGLRPSADLTIAFEGGTQTVTEDGILTLVQDANVGDTFSVGVLDPPAAQYCGPAELSYTVADPPVPIALACVRSLQFATGQAADVALGHPLGFSNYDLPSQYNVGTPGGAMRMLDANGTSVLLVADWFENRILGFDDFVTDAGAALVWGQNGNFSTNSAGAMPQKFAQPQSVRGDDDYVVISHYNAHVVEMRDIDGTNEMLTSAWAGTSNQPGCTPMNLTNPRGAVWVNGMLYIADTGNNRVVMWRQSDLQPDGAGLSLVIGQPTPNDCTDKGPGASMSTPWDVWSDGNWLLVTDTQNHRVLVYDPLPTAGNNPPPSYVLGQAALNNNTYATGTCTASTLAGPVNITGDGRNIFISDFTLNRVLVYDATVFPMVSAPTTVLGQSDFMHCGSTTGNSADSIAVSYAGLAQPWGLAVDATHLFVADAGNRRILMFTSQ